MPNRHCRKGSLPCIATAFCNSSTIRRFTRSAWAEVVDLLPANTQSYEVQSKPGTSSRKAIFRMCVEKGWSLTEMTPVERKLEEVFRDLTIPG